MTPGQEEERAREVWADMFDPEKAREKATSISLLAAALEQARREGVGRMRAEILDWAATCSILTPTQINRVMNAVRKAAASLLSAPEAGDRYRAGAEDARKAVLARLRSRSNTYSTIEEAVNEAINDLLSEPGEVPK